VPKSIRLGDRCCPSRAQVRAVLRIAFVGVLLASAGGQDPRPFVSEPSGGLQATRGTGGVGRGSGNAKDRREASTGREDDLTPATAGRGNRTAGRGPDYRNGVGHA